LPFPGRRTGGLYVNLSVYVLNSPINRLDPSGLVHYEVDSQGFHVRLDTKNNITFRVEFEENGTYKILPKPGHSLNKQEMAIAHTKFEELITNPVEQNKMRDAVSRAFDSFNNKTAIRNIGENMRRTCSLRNSTVKGFGTIPQTKVDRTYSVIVVW